MSNKKYFRNLRIKHFFERAFSVNIASVWTRAGIVSRTFRKSRLCVFIDMLWSAARHNCAFQDYLDWDFAILSGKERRTFMTHPISAHYANTLNTDKEASAKLNNKISFNKTYSDLIGREWLDLTETDFDDFRAFALKHKRIFTKDPTSFDGMDVKRLDVDDATDLKALYEKLLEDNYTLVEETIVQHPKMSELNPSSVNTVRAITYFDGEKVHELLYCMRIGRNNYLDNCSNGGMRSIVNDEGVIISAPFNNRSETFLFHPVTNTPVVGFQIPNFDKLRELVDTVARRSPGVPYVGWDIAVTVDGAAVIEGNNVSGMYQAKASTTGIRTGFRPKFKQAIGF